MFLTKTNIFVKAFFNFVRVFYGEPGGVRTPDPRLRRPVLYPTELLTHLLNDNKYNIIKEDICQQN